MSVEHSMQNPGIGYFWVLRGFLRKCENNCILKMTWEGWRLKPDGDIFGSVYKAATSVICISMDGNSTENESFSSLCIFQLEKYLFFPFFFFLSLCCSVAAVYLSTIWGDWGFCCEASMGTYRQWDSVWCSLFWKHFWRLLSYLYFIQ